MPDAYATEEQLADFLPTGIEVDDADRLLRRASELIDSLVTAPFVVDATTKLPTDTALGEALRDACCAQVEFWVEVGEENDVDGLAGTNVAVKGYTGRRAPTLAPRALRFLRSAGLFGPYDGVGWPW